MLALNCAARAVWTLAGCSVTGSTWLTGNFLQAEPAAKHPLAEQPAAAQASRPQLLAEPWVPWSQSAFDRFRQARARQEVVMGGHKAAALLHRCLACLKGLRQPLQNWLRLGAHHPVAGCMVAGTQGSRKREPQPLWKLHRQLR